MTAAIPARLAAIAAIAVLSAPLVAQRIWTVDWQNRPGTDFTDIQPAVDAAAPGDVVLVRGAGVRIWDPADHGYPAPIIDGKGITIAGEGPDMTWISGAVRIRNVPAGESCTLANLRTGTDYEVSISQPATVFASHCQGTVVFRRVAFLGYGFREFSDCRLVVVSESTMHPVCGVRPIRSKLMIDNVTTSWGIYDFNDSTLQFLGAALDAIDSTVWIMRSHLFGQSDIGTLEYYRPAGYTTNSDIWIGASSLLEGGLSRFGFRDGLWDRYVLDGSGGFLVQPSRYYVDPSITIRGTFPWSSYNPLTVAPISAIWTTRTGDTLLVDQRCEPFSVTVLAIGPFQYQPIASIPAPLAVDLGQSILCLSSTQAGGAVQLPLAIPPGLPFGFQIGLQMGAMSPSGTISLSNATVFGVY